MTPSYQERFATPEKVASYEGSEYASDGYAAFVWSIQKKLLADVLRGVRREADNVRLLDFACGTGRILAFAGPLVDDAVGVDISAAMVEEARRKCGDVELVVGDLIGQPDLVEGEFDVITAFRFLLNVDEDTREAALACLRKKMSARGGLFICNMHGNRRSLRHPIIAFRKWQRRRRPSESDDRMLAEMTTGEVRALLHRHGFEIIRQSGFGMVPQALHRTPLRRIFRRLDSWAAGKRATRNISIDTIFVCEPA
ncbi:hypothetical protein BH23VER1_BH23VER1_23920 [soil metagenome]